MQGDLGYNRRLMFLCLFPAGAFRSHVKLNLFHHISSACNSAIVEVIHSL